jgi:archaellum component FlaG (FlaF/FlaG flagellin family)
MKNLLMIKKVLFFAISLFIANGAYAQVGIGTTNPNADALLELSSTDQGLLIPRVALTATNLPAPLNNHVPGMIVYNTASNGPVGFEVTAGFYYNDGIKWLKLLKETNGIGVDDTDDAWLNNSTAGYVHLNTLSDGTTVRPVGKEVVFTDEGKLGIGTDAPSESIQIMANDADLDMYSFTEPAQNNLTVFHIHAAGGTVDAPLPVSSRTEPNIFSIESKAFDGTNYRIAASITVAVDGTPSVVSGPDDMPGRISFFTTPDGSYTQIQRMVIKNTGNVGIGVSEPQVKLDVDGMIKTKGYSVVELLALTPVKGAMAFVNDVLITPTPYQQVDNTHDNGFKAYPVFYNGSHWVYH